MKGLSEDSSMGHVQLLDSLNEELEVSNTIDTPGGTYVTYLSPGRGLNGRFFLPEQTGIIKWLAR